MSRYSLKPLRERSDIFEVAVGWDPGLSTYFTIVFCTPEFSREPEALLWCGRTFGEICEVAALLEIVQEFAEVAPEMRSRLDADRSAEPTS